MKKLNYSLIHILPGHLLTIFYFFCFPMYLSPPSILHIIFTTLNSYCLSLLVKMEAL